MPAKTFVALFRGPTMEQAKVVAVSTDRNLVAFTAAAMCEAEEPVDDPDPVTRVMGQARRHALALLAEGGPVQ